MKDYSNLDIVKEISNIVAAYNRPISIVDGLQFRQRDLIRTIEFYTNSKYLDGAKDEMGRDKPFYNIVNGMCDVENAAKDIDTKDVQWTSNDGNHYAESFMLTKDIQQWMQRADFAETLNDIRDTHTRYGSVLVKKCIEKDEEGYRILEIELPEWKNVITDQNCIEDGPIIEVHHKTVSDVMQMTEWSNVEDAVGAMIKETGYIGRLPIYEVRGWFPISFYKQVAGLKPSKTDKKVFSYQLFYFAGPGSSNIFSDSLDVTKNFALGNLIPLYWENDTEEVYKYAARKKRAGRGFGVGVVEEGEEAQVWTNDTVLKQFRAMEYTTKVVGQSASKKLKGRNMLNEVEDGQILEHEDGKPITTLALLPSGGLGQYQMLLAQWFTQFERATSAYGAQRGESPSSRTAAKLQAAVLQQSGSVMQTIQEDLGLFIAEILEDWVMPFLAKELNTEHILAHEFSMDELKQIDRNFSTHVANTMAKEMILSGQIVSPEQYDGFFKSADDMIKQTKATRFLQIPKGYYKNAISHGSFNITGESKNKQASIDSLLGIMKIYQADPNLINDPIMTTLLMQIIELSGAGISPITIIAAIQEKARIAAEEAKQGAQQQQQRKVAQSINFKDLPPEGQRQMAAEVGIDIQPTAQPQMQPMQAGQPETPPQMPA